MTQPNLIGRTVQQTNEWLNALAADEALANEDRALGALRGVLHQVRDHVPVPQAAQVAAQLPTLIRGVYYEGYRPADVPETERSQSGFLAGVKERCGYDDLEPEAATRAVFALLSREMTDGQAAQLAHLMPDDVKALFPKEVRQAEEGVAHKS